jgi:hypothetical protein
MREPNQIGGIPWRWLRPVLQVVSGVGHSKSALFELPLSKRFEPNKRLKRVPA